MERRLVARRQVWFLERYRWYLAAVGEDGSDDKKKVAILLTVAGTEAQAVFRTFTYEPAKATVGNQPAVPAETAEHFNTVVRKFTEFWVLRNNVIYERYVFHTRVQEAEIEERGLVKAERPTDWVLPLVTVEKPNGDLRLCLDPMA
ncbi:hypothetical protein NP493_1471g00038 [Ridgeia piscesae]|uniref:Uncharacterized protein n=1 Tax=Ridgeia piscesae TaxID=27915 RepID=A0AAD9K3B1_RIDPI|nr:hypothetical protein NP493_1471g00038 [Ridgeia piscesae]